MTRSSPATRTAASGPCSTSTASRRGGRRRRARCWCSASPRCPGAGDNFLVVAEDRIARQIAEQRAGPRAQRRSWRRPRAGVTLEDLLEALEEGEASQLNLILKGDVSGSVEALEDALLKIDVGDEVDAADHPPRRRCDHPERRQPGQGVATRSSSASTSGAEGKVARARRPRGRRGPLLLGHLPGDRGGRGGAQGHAQAGVRGGRSWAPPRSARCSARSKFGNIAGCIVRSGVIRRNAKARLLRDGAVVAENLTIESLRRFKDDATEVREGFECGIGLGTYNDIKVDDVIETFEMREKPRA